MNNVLKVLYARALGKGRIIEHCIDLIKSNLYFKNLNGSIVSIEDDRIETNIFIRDNGGKWNSNFWQLEHT